MNDHAVDAMLYAWLVMKEKGGYKMIDYINFGNVVNVSTSVPVAIDDSTYHIIIDFVPDDTMIFDNFHDDMAKILKHPDDYVLCNVGDITKAQDELLKLKDRVKELETEKNTWKEKCFAMICTMCDGSKQTVSMGLTDDTGDKCTMGAFVCRAFNIPQCKNCKNHRYFTNSGHYCHLPDSKYTIPGMFHIHSLTDGDAEGPACDKFEARKE